MSEFDFNVGAQVKCEDGKCGQLLKVVVDPEAQEVTDLIVERGFLLKDDRVLPIELVEDATADEIRLSITGDQLSHFEAYDEKAFEVPGPAWQQLGAYAKGEAVKWTATATPYGVVTSKPIVPKVRQRVHEGISAKETVVEQGTVVENAQGEVGTVDHVLVDPDSGDIEYYIADRGLLARSVVIPASDVREVTEDVIFVDLGEDELDNLPRYRPPAKASMLKKLQERLEAAPFDFSDVKAVLEGGVLQLSGTVPNVAGKRRAETTARSIEGVVDVENTLDTDTAIVARVTAALADDSRTELADVDVTSERGVVTLTGQVDSAEIREAAEETAENQSGVIEVINDLAIEPDEDTEVLERRTAGVVLGRNP
jgi:uncharacterized protein YrrD